MPRSFTYKDASKYNHKMASKYASFQDDNETFTIGSGTPGWQNLTRDELMAIPWMKEAIESTDTKLFIDDCLGFDIMEVTEAGAIHLKKGDYHLRIARNTRQPSRLALKGFYRFESDDWLPDPNYPRDIRCATVSANFGTLPDGFRVFTSGPKKYYYLKNGELSKHPLCLCYESRDDGYCCCYESDLDY